jgi:N utilization substance protein A
MAKSEFELAFNEIADLRALPQETIIEALKTALISAYRRDSNASAAQKVDATVDPASGRTRIYVEKEVVDEVLNPGTEVDLETARYFEPEAEYGDTVMVQVEGTTKQFGRIAAQTAKQVILQKIREAERETLYAEFVEKEGDIVNGQVQSVNSAVVTLSLGRAEAIMPRTQQIPGERYRPHDKVRCYVMEVKRGTRGPQIVVSRSHRHMLRRLLEFEVPEIYNGQIEIKNIAREAGYRSKVAVVALQEGIDPVGACVGMRGIRIQNIVKELHDEKIDVIEWNSNQELFIEKALSPARVTGVYLDDDPDSGRTAVVVVPDDQLSLAIGREGQNARLAAKLTGWRIDIKSVTEAVSNALANLSRVPLNVLETEIPDMLANIRVIVEKQEAGRVVTPEDYRLLNEFSDIAERRLQAVRDEARKARIEEINAVKATLPEYAFTVPVLELDLPDFMIESLQPLENVGEIMLRFLIDEERLRRMLGGDTDANLMQLQEALDALVIPDGEIAEESLEADAQSVIDDAEIESDISADIETGVTPATAFPDVLPSDDDDDEGKRKRKAQKRAQEVPVSIDEEFFDDDDVDVLESDLQDSKKKRQTDRQRRRQLVYDEETGETYAKRRRKGGRGREDWEV